MFDLDAFDREVSDRFAQRSRSAKARDRIASKLRHTQIVPAICVILSSATAAWAYADATKTPSELAEMTYNGMTLADFAASMELPVTDPYLITLFQDLCAQEQEA